LNHHTTMKIKPTDTPKAEPTPQKKYTKTGNAPGGEWVVKDNATGEEKHVSAFGDVTTENTDWN